MKGSCKQTADQNITLSSAWKRTFLSIWNGRINFDKQDIIIKLSNYGWDKVSSAAQTRVNVVTHRGGDARNWPLLPGQSGRAESQGGRERLRAVQSKVCCSCCWGEGEDSKTAAVAAGKAISFKHPNFSLKTVVEEVALPRSGMHQAGSRARSLPAPNCFA